MPSREKCWERTGGGMGGGGCQAEDEPRIKHAWSKAGSWETGRGWAASRCSKPGVFFFCRSQTDVALKGSVGLPEEMG